MRVVMVDSTGSTAMHQMLPEIQSFDAMKFVNITEIVIIVEALKQLNSVVPIMNFSNHRGGLFCGWNKPYVELLEHTGFNMVQVNGYTSL